jgi:hypothetical protein
MKQPQMAKNPATQNAKGRNSERDRCFVITRPDSTSQADEIIQAISSRSFGETTPPQRAAGSEHQSGICPCCPLRVWWLDAPCAAVLGREINAPVGIRLGIAPLAPQGCRNRPSPRDCFKGEWPSHPMDRSTAAWSAFEPTQRAGPEAKFPWDPIARFNPALEGG